METDDEFAREIREAAENAEATPPPERAKRFYDRIRGAVRRYVVAAMTRREPAIDSGAVVPA